MFQRILVAIDQTDHHQAVLQTAIDLAKLTQARLKLVHGIRPVEETVPNPIFPSDSISPAVQVEELQMQMQNLHLLEQAGQELLQSRLATVATAGVTAEVELLIGEAGNKICEAARQWQADLIVVGRRGHRGLQEMLLGSVSNYVLHHATCAVLTVQNDTSVT